MRRSILSMVLLVIHAAPALGQSDSVLTRILSDSSSLIMDRLAVRAALPPEKTPVGSIRLASAAGGFVSGLVFGGFAGSEIASERCTRNCHTYRGDALIAGAAIGGSLGAALGAAFLNLESVCAFDKRLLRTLFGSTVGASAMFAAAQGWDRRRAISVIPLGAVGGSLAALGKCWKGRQQY